MLIPASFRKQGNLVPLRLYTLSRSHKVRVGTVYGRNGHLTT